ncbi:Periodic tryptophan protein 1-like [Papilio machaon]|uniref:Periodic tryptophan protein 1-like n=1 Tax=Papilio machaon TaxID=76193 RepID=A0A194RKE3_PAPMA|nr:Periodic tryptophan protein 1-like [Papilio machaon]
MEENTPTVSLVSCMHFVQRGVAKSVPEKIELTEKELEKIIKQTADDLRITEQGDDQSDEEGETETREPPANPNDEFNFDQYDEEDSITVNPIGIGTVATLPNLGDLSENVQIRTEGPDSDEEDDIIKPTDNLLLVGHVESDASILEVHIFNKEEGSFYVHHDIILPWFPLCIEWLSHDPTDPQPGNLCALGGMDPVIQVWDLDIENCLEPAFKLGKKPNKKKKIKRVGHKDAVLDLSWNKNFTHVLASGSADKTVLLWDLDQGTPHTKINYFSDKRSTALLYKHYNASGRQTMELRFDLGRFRAFTPFEGATQVSMRSNKSGQSLCVAACPDAPLSLALGGDNKQCHIELVDLTANEQGEDHTLLKPAHYTFPILSQCF